MGIRDGIRLSKAASRGGLFVGVIVVGAGAAGKGILDLAHSRSMRQEAETKLKSALSDLEDAQKPVHALLDSYGREQIEAVRSPVGQFADWIEKNQMSVNRLEHNQLDGFVVSVPELMAMKFEVEEAALWAQGGIASASVAIAAPKVALLGVAKYAKASTGKPISTLNGAAETKAVLAWLGGGSRATGGGGMAVGQVILGLLAFAPAAFVGGLTVAVIGSKKKTSAMRYEADVDRACANMETAKDLLPRVQERVAELSAVLESLRVRGNQALVILEGLNFDPDRHAVEFHTTLELIRGIREVLNAPMLDDSTGQLTDVSLQIVRKYG